MSDVESAKAYLLQASSKSGINLYDHLASTLATLLDERPNDAVESFEEVSRQVKADSYAETTTMKSLADPSTQVDLAEVQVKMFKKEGEEDAGDEDEEAEPVIDNMVEQMSYFNDGGCGLGREETFRMSLALQQLKATGSFQKIRFWGKVFGLYKNYYIAECAYTEGEEPQAPDAEDGDGGDGDADADGDGEGDENELPKSEWKAPKPLPVEEYGAGANKFIYFVCTEPGLPWVKLPHVSPAQVTVARKIKKLFTGDLSAPVEAYPPFDGTEENYLRAQIAQISADTVISPQGYYTFDDEADDEEEQTEFVRAPPDEYEGMSREKLMDADSEGPDGWCHHTQFILEQGRCKWVNPNPKAEDEEEDDEDEEDEAEEVIPETGPSLLSSIMSDPQVDGFPAWTPKTTSQMNLRYAGVIMSSNRWPGAHALAYDKGKFFQNMYIGHGHKYASQPYSPPLPPPAQEEYKVDETCMETSDPTAEQVEQWNADQAKGEGSGDEEEED